MAHGMLEFDAPRVERNAAPGQRTPGAVFQVAADRAPDLRQLGAYLVVAPRQQLHLHERIVRPRAQRRIAQPRLLFNADFRVIPSHAALVIRMPETVLICIPPFWLIS